MECAIVFAIVAAVTIAFVMASAVHKAPKRAGQDDDLGSERW